MGKVKQLLDSGMVSRFRRGCFDVYAKQKQMDRRRGRGTNNTTVKSRTKKNNKGPAIADEKTGRDTGIITESITPSTGS
jgi:hypothetical protein